MKKRAALVLILPAFGALIAGCTIPAPVKNAIFKAKDVVVTGVNKAVDAMDKFFEEPKQEEKKEETKPVEEKTTEENTTTPEETGEGEGQEESGEETGSEEN